MRRKKIGIDSYIAKRIQRADEIAGAFRREEED